MPIDDVEQVDWQLTRFQPIAQQESLTQQLPVSSLEASGVVFGASIALQSDPLIDLNKETGSKCQQDPLIKDGAWNNNDWYSLPDKIQVITGQVCTYDVNLLQRIRSVEAPYLSQLPLQGEPSATYALPIPLNVARILQLLPRDKFKQFFPLAAELYTYDGFIQAVTAFPKFCGEKGTVQQAAKLTLDQVCKKELSTLFTHIVWKTGERDSKNSLEPWLQGLKKIADYNDSQYETTSKFYSGPGQFVKRGALLRGGIEFYGRLSTLLFNDAQVLLNQPQRVEKEPFLAFASAFYFYMTPQDNFSPSMHEIQTGFWSPNEVDKSAGISPGFGATIMLVSPSLCGSINQEVQTLYTYYISFMTSFTILVDFADSEICAKSTKFPVGGSAILANAYFQKSTDGSTKCDLVSEKTRYSLFQPGDYKRCIIEQFAGIQLSSYYFIKDYNYLPGDLVTNGIQLWQCSDLPFGLGCKNQQGPTLGQSSTSWIQTTGTVTMVQPEWDTFLFNQLCTDWVKGLSWNIEDFACDGSRTWKCQVPGECSHKKPSSQGPLDQAWQLTRLIPVSNGQEASQIDTFVQSFEWNLNFNYINQDRVFMRKAQEMAAINSIWECQQANQILCAVVIPGSNAQVWTSVAGTALEIQVPKVESKSCFDWKSVQNTKVATGTEPSYKFRIGDFACDATRVWICKDGDGCQTIQPSKDASNEAWTLQRFSPYAVVPTPDRVCVEWSNIYRFVPNDLVCKSGKMWKCQPQPRALECSQAAPKLVPTVIDPWQLVSDSLGYETQVTALDDQKCISFDAVTGPTATTPYVFVQGNYACDASRVFLCRQSALCSTVKPSLDDGTAWQLTRFKVVEITTKTVQSQIYELQDDLLAEKGIWTGRDWTDIQNKIQNKNGNISGLDSTTQRRLWSMQAVLKMDTINLSDPTLNKANVQRVMRVLPEPMWEKLTPFRLFTYTYQSFLTAVSRYPAFCAERGTIGQAAKFSDDQICLKELATLFAHFTQETGWKVPGATVPQGHVNASQVVQEEWLQALARTEQVSCENGVLAEKCKGYYSEANNQGTVYPRPSTSVNYFGRGALQLKWNYNYGAFSNSIFGDSSVLLNNPERVASEGWLAFASALWIYMTPVSPKPSMHDIVAGFWQPNQNDQASGLTLGFGATINVFAGVEECGNWNQNAFNRVIYYQQIINFFAIPIANKENLYCNQQSFVWSKSGAGALAQYFDKDSNNNAQCKIVPYLTQWSFAIPGDYKRCVCFFYGPCNLTITSDILFAAQVTNCIGWALNFNYLPGDLIYYGKKVWKARQSPQTLLCSTIEPSESAPCWQLIDSVSPEPGAMPELQKQRCYDYQTHTSSTAIIPYSFTGGDFACDLNRVWKCLSYSNLCNTVRPSKDILYIWELLRHTPQSVNAPAQVITQNQEITVQNDILTDQGAWTGFDWTDSQKGIKNINGQIQPTSTDMKRRIWAAQAKYDVKPINLISPINNPLNVQRILRLLTEPMWEKLTPFRLPTYTYESFLTAVSRYPAFCGERGLVGQAATLTDDQVCFKELATLFAHMAQETGYHVANSYAPAGSAGAGQLVPEEWRQALARTEEWMCENGILADKCKSYYSEANDQGTIYPRSSTDKHYFGRGALQLKWNYNYGAFSNSIFGDAKVLLENPGRVASEGWLAFASALWIYMTPVSPKPSMHDIVAGFWSPVLADSSNGLTFGFGATINAFTGGEECGTWNQKAKWRTEYYNELITYFNVPISQFDENSCINTKSRFSTENTSNIASFFEKDGTGTKCKLTTSKTNWSIYIPGDYKRCVCFYYGPCDLTATLPTSAVEAPQSYCFAYQRSINYLPGDFVCDTTNTWECSSLPNGFKCKNEDLSQTAVWKVKNLVKTMALAPMPMSEFSKCYDYQKSVTPGSASQYAFKLDDKACDEDRVWICKDAQKCNITKPSTNDGTVWTLTRDFPVFGQAISFNSVNAINYAPQKDILPFNGIWTGFDWVDSVNQIENVNGQIQGKDQKLTRFIWAAQARYDLKAVNLEKVDQNPANVRRVMSVISKDTWEYILPLRNAIFSYEEFLTAVSKFPAFCGEKGTHGQASTLSNDDMCKKEIAALLAHAVHATGLKKVGATVPLGQMRAGEVVNEIWRQGLYYNIQRGCQGLTPATTCTNYFSIQNGNDINYPRPDTQTNYFGRGAYMTRWNYNYGMFSELIFGDVKTLLNKPELIADEGWLGFASALWFYMTPLKPKPSMHDIITGFWVPNAADTSAGFKAGFGATINVINGGQECGKWTQNASDRYWYFKEMMMYFKVPIDPTEDSTCQTMQRVFPKEGSAAVMMHFDKDWKNKNRCVLVKWVTPYSMITPGDYKRCVCNFYGPCDLTPTKTVTKVFVPDYNCFSYQQSFNYLPGDTICDATSSWKCNSLPIALNCASQQPNLFAQVESWIVVQLTSIIQGPAPAVTEQSCFDYETQKAQYTFAINDFACDASRVWKCLTQACTGTKPSTGNGTVWALTRFTPQVIVPFIPTVINYTSQKDILNVDGIWTGKDWKDQGYESVNGQISGTETKTKRRLWVSQAIYAQSQVDLQTVANNPANVQRVMSVLKENQWAYLFPFMHPGYNYKAFITAVSKYPAFCGERGAVGQASTLSDDELCKKELSTLFAHITQATGYKKANSIVPAGLAGAGQSIAEEWRQGLSFVEEQGCQNGLLSGQCYKYYSTQFKNDIFYPRPSDLVNYFGRGAMNMAWNYNFGSFSENIFGDEKLLLENPERVAQEPWLAFASALWVYMTPQSPKPSIHDVVAGFWQPNADDLAKGLKLGFGSTINILNSQECGLWTQTAQNRIDYYKGFMSYFVVGLDVKEELTCEQQSNEWPLTSSGSQFMYFDQDWSSLNQCKLVSWQTSWSLFNPGDYKRCVCYYYGPCILNPVTFVSSTCFTNEVNYNWLAGDFICDDRQIWKCQPIPLVLQCKTETPSSFSKSWTLTNRSIVQGKAPVMGSMGCYEYSEVVNSYTFRQNEFACDQSRVWMCKSTTGCNGETPSTGFEVKWLLTRYQPIKKVPATQLVLDYIPQTDILPVNGPWTNYNWVDSTNGYQAINGQISGTSTVKKRFLWAPMAKFQSNQINFIDVTQNPVNVKRVMRLFTEPMWEKITPFRLPTYTYESFLTAVSRYPAFCGERGLQGQAANLSDDHICLKELAALFAHMAQETGWKVPGATVPQGHAGAGQVVQEDWRQALARTEEWMCENGILADKCKSYYSEANNQGTIYPRSSTDKHYFGRGALQLKWNYNYGAFSNSIFGDTKVLLENPERVASEGWLAFASALWIYMTPVSPKPSMHDIVAGFWTPNTADTAAGFKRGFGATINILNGLEECQILSQKAKDRTYYYESLLLYFNVAADSSEDNTCSSQQKVFSEIGAGSSFAYFDKSNTSKNQCSLINVPTGFSMFNPGDYKRCVCFYFGPCDLTPISNTNIVVTTQNCFPLQTNFNYMPLDKVCDATTMWQCPSAQTDALQCALQSPTSLTSIWTQIKEKPVSGSAPTIQTQKCYNWSAVTPVGSLTPYKFVIDDFALESNRVWKCKSNVTCNATKPSSDNIAAVWQLTRFTPNVQIPQVVNQVTEYDPQPDILPKLGPWSGHDWIDTVNSFKVIEGQLFGTTEKTQRDLWSAQAKLGVAPVDFNNKDNNKDNVKRVLSVFPKDKFWAYLTPFSIAVYTYENFVTAISKYPAFCGEKGTVGQASQLSIDQVCLKEIAALFAHFGQETGYHYAGSVAPAGTSGAGQLVQEEWRQSLYYLTEIACSDTTNQASYCDYYSTSYNNDINYPRKDSTIKFFGRGPFQLSWNYNYGQFSEVIFGDSKVLLDSPERVANEGWLAFAAAFWFYMTPQSPKPSMHDVITGFWQPNSVDLAAGFKIGFGATINIINGGQECGFVSEKAKFRQDYFVAIMNYLQVPLDSNEQLSCSSQQNQFQLKGTTGLKSQYFDKDWSNKNRCIIVSWYTSYSIYTPGDYKRCVCYYYGPCDLTPSTIVVPIIVTAQTCFAFTLNFNYLAGDKVCNNTNIWTCNPLPKTLKCASEQPSGLGSGEAWTLSSGTISIGPAPFTKVVDCFDYETQKATYTFKLSDFACDANRLWKCVLAASCTSTKPSTGNDSIWMLQRDLPNAVVPQSAAIVSCQPQKDILITDGPWTGNDMTDATNGIKVVNGQVQGTVDSTIRSICSAQAVLSINTPDFNDITKNPPNVQRVMKIMTREVWEYLTPFRNSIYTYESFITAISKYPAFCGERGSHGQAQQLTDVQICKKEIAALFAHFCQETGYNWPNSTVPAGYPGAGKVVSERWRQAFYYVKEKACDVTSPDIWSCAYYSDSYGNDVNYPRPDTKTQYFGRGALQLSWNYNYGYFSELIFGDAKTLLNKPERVANEGWLAIASALWFYMTPQTPKPSMHDIITGFWVPNAADTSAGFKSGFGATINVINGVQECGFWSQYAQHRSDNFKSLMGYFQVPLDSSEDIGCSAQSSTWPLKGSAVVFSHFDKDWNKQKTCKLVSWQTAWSLYSLGDYKRCVCNYDGPCDLSPQQVVDPTIIETKTCFSFTAQFNFLPEDRVCDTQNIWECQSMPAALACSTEVPTPANTGPAWYTVPISIRSGSAPTYSSKNCYDYQTARSQKFTFVIDSLACDSGRVFKCSIASSCNTTTPSTGNGTVWTLLRDTPIVLPIPQVIQIDYTPQADILPVDGPWTKFDWKNLDLSIQNINGKITGMTPESQRIIWSPQARFDVRDVDFTTISNNPQNVQRLMNILTREKWQYLTPFRIQTYSYESFIAAISKYPAFCGEKGIYGQAQYLSMDDVCKKEIATLFAHFAQETGYNTPGSVAPGNTAGAGQFVQEQWRQSLYYLTEIACSDTTNQAQNCDYYSTSYNNDVNYPRKDSTIKFFGRGPFQLSWNYNYGSFSKVQFGDTKVLLDAPERVANEGWLAFSAALWFYMTPQSPKPSMHDIITGFWQPNNADLAAGFKHGFGATINVINGGQECGFVSSKAKSRSDNFIALMQYFQVPVDITESLNCSGQQNQFSATGAGVTAQYFDKDPQIQNSCKLVNYYSPYNLFSPGDYKRCVCNFYGPCNIAPIKTGGVQNCFAYAENYNYLSDDRVCNGTKIWACQPLPKALSCKTQNPTILPYNDAWIPTEETGQIVSTPPQISQACYDWAVSTNGLDVYKTYIFKLGDFSCNVARVWKCMASDTSLCNKTEPKTTTNSNVWQLTRYTPEIVVPQVPPNCFPYVQNFLFMPDDRVCTTTAIWQCQPLPLALQCATETPDPTKDGTAWKKLSIPPSTQAAPATSEKECYDWTVSVLNNAIPYKFILNEFACDENRVWKCLNANFCSNSRPKSGDGQIWALTRSSPKVIIAPVAFGPSTFEPQVDTLPKDGVWTGKDFSDAAQGIKVENGRVFGISDENKRFIWSSQGRWDVAPVDIVNQNQNPLNVQRVMRVLTADKWEHITPCRQPAYSYAEFLKAVSKYPAFCGEKGTHGNAATLSDDEMCLKEIAALFAHIDAQSGGSSETGCPAGRALSGTPVDKWRQGLYYTKLVACDVASPSSDCDYFSTQFGNDINYPRTSSATKYFGRGSVMLTWNYNYGAFSKAVFGDQAVLLNDPERVATEGWIAFASALWFYMTPKNQTPSMHSVITGYWKPNSQDTSAGFKSGFGATITIFNFGCGSDPVLAASNFVDLLKYFNVAADLTESVSCNAAASSFPVLGAAGSSYVFFDNDWSNPGRCKLVNYGTSFSMFTPGDYKRCVCFYQGPCDLKPQLSQCFAYQANFNYLPGDLVCDATSMWKCEVQPTALTCKTEVPQASGSGVAWKKVVFTINQVAAPTYDKLNCYDYTITRSYSFSKPYSFVQGDFACDLNRVWKCIKSDQCDSKKPSTDDGTVWALQRENPTPVSAPVPPNCYQFSNGYNYVPGDRVCSDTLMWQCKELPSGLQCATTQPSSTGSDPAWSIVNAPISKGTAPAITARECYDWTKTTTDKVYQIVSGDYICDSNRVWQCKDAAQCNLQKPNTVSTSQVWTLLSFSPKNIIPALPISSGTCQWTPFTTSKFTNQNWIDVANQYEIKNGLVCGKTEEMTRRLKSIEAPYLNQVPAEDTVNQQRVKRVFSEADFKTLFPLAQGIYTYNGFLNAVKAYPAFCNEKGTVGQAATLSLDQICMKELATLFTHFAAESGANLQNLSTPAWKQGLYYTDDPNCYPNQNGSVDCKFHLDKVELWPPYSQGSQYYGRGPLFVKGNAFYGALSVTLFNDRSQLMTFPGRVSAEEFIAFASAIHFYMRPDPQSWASRPSMHEIIAGFWKPNAADGSVKPGFGTTIMLIKKEICSFANAQASMRYGYYKNFMAYFNLAVDPTEAIDCSAAQDFAQSGSADVTYPYFERTWTGPSQCTGVNYETAWTIFRAGDYERCLRNYFV